MFEKTPRFPESFSRTENETDNQIFKEINEAIEELWKDQGTGLNSVIYKPGFIVINRDPMKQMDSGKIIVILQEAFIADFNYD